MDSKKVVGVILVIPILGVLVNYLAGCIYFFMNDGNLSQVMPLTFIEQWRYYHDDITYQKSLNIAAMEDGRIAFIVPLLIVMFTNRDIEELYGSARWVNNNEVFNLYKLAKNKDDGKEILIGRLGRRFLYYTGNAFVFLAAASRTGKGIGIIIPNLLRWFGNCVVTDFNKENFAITSKFRKEVLKQDVYLFNPFDESGETHAAKEPQITIESVAQEIVEPISVFASPLDNLPSNHAQTQSKPESSIADEQALASLSESHYDEDDLSDF